MRSSEDLVSILNQCASHLVILLTRLDVDVLRDSRQDQMFGERCLVVVVDDGSLGVDSVLRISGSLSQ
jgi:hypothetical protein